MGEYRKQHHHRHPRGRNRGAWHRGSGAEMRESGPWFRRRFATRDERIARLTAYLGELRSEAEAVEERIAALSNASSN